LLTADVKKITGEKIEKHILAKHQALGLNKLNIKIALKLIELISNLK